MKIALTLVGKTAIRPMRVRSPTETPILKPKTKNAIITGI